ncbi:MAG: universal stress protein [Rhodospirillaceae bacterium]
MCFKTILLHIGNDECHPVRLHVAVELARRFDSFLDVVYFRGTAGSVDPERAVRIEEEVHHACLDRSYSWTEIEGDPLKTLALRAGFADLAIVSQANPANLEDEALPQLADHLAGQTACPVLVLPWGTSVEAPGRHILLAWKNCPEAGRALRDAIPLLLAADRVTVLTVGFDSADDSEPTDISVYLERHGVEADFHPDSNSDSDAGDVILAVADELECDAIVMGCFSHSRLRDMVMGSATDSVLTKMRVPVLLSG